MSAHHERLEQVRRVVAAGGGWNRRSRATLLAWARAEALSDAELSALLSEALGLRVKAVPPEARSMPARSESSRPGSRWWLAIPSLAGLAVSALLIGRLSSQVRRQAQRVPEPPPATAAAPGEMVRRLPPPPVPFTQPPAIEQGEQRAMPEPTWRMGQRPVGELSRVDLKRFADAWREACANWPASQPLERAATIRDLATWIAASASQRDTQRLAEARSEVRESSRGTRAAMLADAFEAMVVAEVARAPQLSSWAAEGVPADAPASASDALRAWALARVPTLAAEYAAPDARERWSTWMQCVATLPETTDRVRCAIEGLSAIVRGGADISRPGVSTDAAGSLVATLPFGVQQPAFAQVRDAWAEWLADPGIASARLWALGGIWRAREPGVDVTLLPGERDGARERRALASRWKSIEPARAVAWWQSLQQERRRPHPGPQASAEARIDDLSARVRLLRRIAHAGAGDVAAPMPLSPPAREPAVEVAPRWSAALLDRAPEARLRALRVMQAAAPASIAPVDAEALAACALTPRTTDEGPLAQDVVRGSLRESPAMREALAHELAVTGDPRPGADFLCDIAGTRLPVDDADTLRAAAIGALLDAAPGAGDQAAARLLAEVAAWEGSAVSDLVDAGAAAWRLAGRATREAGGLRPPEVTRALVQDAEQRARRLQRLADRGPRAFAGALASLCDVEAARLSVRRLSDADALRLIADQASAARSRAPDAIEQAAISLDALADMQLMAAGAQAASLPMATVRGVPDAVAAARSLDDADRALAKPAPDTGAAIEALRRAFEADAATAPSVALGLAQVSSTGPQRRAWLEAAELLGAGASLPDDASSDRREALGAAQLLAWAARGQGDRLALARLSGPQRQAADRLAVACGVSSEQCMQALRETDDRLHQVTVAALRARVAAALGSGHPSWSSVIDGGQASPLPEADAARPWRLVVP